MFSQWGIKKYTYQDSLLDISSFCFTFLVTVSIVPFVYIKATFQLFLQSWCKSFAFPSVHRFLTDGFMFVIKIKYHYENESCQKVIVMLKGIPSLADMISDLHKCGFVICSWISHILDTNFIGRLLDTQESVEALWLGFTTYLSWYICWNCTFLYF